MRQKYITITNFENELKNYGKLTYINVGDSMMPMLRQKQDMIIIEPVRHRLRKYDIPLYKRDSGQYVLHRILKVRENDYVICGDNRWQKEYGITDEQIIGVLTAFVRNGKTISVEDIRYVLYVHIWCDFFYIRVGFLKLRLTVKKIKNRFEKGKK